MSYTKVEATDYEMSEDVVTFSVVTEYGAVPTTLKMTGAEIYALQETSEKLTDVQFCIWTLFYDSEIFDGDPGDVVGHSFELDD